MGLAVEETPSPVPTEVTVVVERSRDSMHMVSALNRDARFATSRDRADCNRLSLAATHMIDNHISSAHERMLYVASVSAIAFEAVHGKHLQTELQQQWATGTMIFPPKTSGRGMG